jgi:hypothetical protein
MQQFLSNTVTPEEVEEATANIEDNIDNQHIHREVLLSINADTCIEDLETSSYTPPVLSPQERVSLKQTAEEILSGIKKDVEVQYLIPVTEKSPRETGMHMHILQT